VYFSKSSREEEDTGVVGVKGLGEPHPLRSRYWGVSAVDRFHYMNTTSSSWDTKVHSMTTTEPHTQAQSIISTHPAPHSTPAGLTAALVQYTGAAPPLKLLVCVCETTSDPSWDLPNKRACYMGGALQPGYYVNCHRRYEPN
jgi:hypothetical protein